MPEYESSAERVLADNQRVLEAKLDQIFALLSSMSSRQEIDVRMRR